jgi:hypothetical protein
MWQLLTKTDGKDKPSVWYEQETKKKNTITTNDGGDDENNKGFLNSSVCSRRGRPFSLTMMQNKAASAVKDQVLLCASVMVCIQKIRSKNVFRLLSLTS